MNYAIVEIGSTQHRVRPGDRIRVQRMEGDPGGSVSLDRVLLVQTDGDVKVGAPYVAGATVRATLLGDIKGRKVIIFKKKRRKQYRRTRGHRQPLTSLQIDEIVLGG